MNVEYDGGDVEYDGGDIVGVNYGEWDRAGLELAKRLGCETEDELYDAMKTHGWRRDKKSQEVRRRFEDLVK